MKKNNLITGVIYLVIGVVFLVFTILFETKLNSIFAGFAGAGIGGGSLMLWNYYYWTNPKNENKYTEKVEERNIELNDERKKKLRDKSGRYAYITGLIILLISIIAFSILGSLEIINNTRLIIIYLGGFLLFQYVIGVIIYNYLNKNN